MYPAGGTKGKSVSARDRKDLKADEEEKDNAEKAGFVVTITGYSPYEDLMSLMDPSVTGDDKSKWGFVTRLMHFNDFVPDGNSPFELYGKNSLKQFNLEIGEMSVGGEMPADIGLTTTKSKGNRLKAMRADEGEQVLLDPMTKETISRTAAIDDKGKKKVAIKTGKEMYEVNDHWFKLDVKFIWKDAAGEPGKGAMSGKSTTTMPASGAEAGLPPAATFKGNASKEIAPKKGSKKKDANVDY